MWIDKLRLFGGEILLSVFAVYLFISYFDIFFERRKNWIAFSIGLTVFVSWQFVIAIPINFPAYINIAITILITLFAITTIYKGIWLNKCVFAIVFNAIWMLLETLCNYILVIYCEKYAMIQSVGSLLSKIFYLMVIIALKNLFTDNDIKELSAKYSVMLVLIPTGSIYIMNNIFMLGIKANSNHMRFNSAITAIILLAMNILIFYIYMKMSDDLQLRRMTSVYEQQLELCERHQQEREISIMQLRDVRHNMKNNLISILAYAENKEYKKIIGFVHDIMSDGGMAVEAVSNSGNIVVDSLIGYWYVIAQKKEIDFSVDICVPMMMPFKGADLCLILGNLLENAIEATQKVHGKRYIKIRMKYDKDNLLLFMTNNYEGHLLKSKNGKLKSTKLDTVNHGIGLPSIYRVVAKYHGTVVIEDSVPHQFKIRLLLYGS